MMMMDTQRLCRTPTHHYAAFSRPPVSSSSPHLRLCLGKVRRRAGTMRGGSDCFAYFLASGLLFIIALKWHPIKYISGQEMNEFGR